MDILCMKKNGKLILNKKRNISDISLSYLHNYLQLDKNITLRDIFKFINKNKIFYFIYCFCYCKEYVEAGLKAKKKNTKEYDTLNITYSCNISSYEQNSFYDCWEFYGTKNKTKYSLSLAPIEDLIDIPIVISKEGILTIESKNKQDTIIKISKDITFENFLYAIFYELSFHGNSKDKQKFSNKLIDTKNKHMSKL